MFAGLLFLLLYGTDCIWPASDVRMQPPLLATPDSVRQKLPLPGEGPTCGWQGFGSIEALEAFFTMYPQVAGRPHTIINVAEGKAFEFDVDYEWQSKRYVR